jgi:hypothetical protein
MVVIVPLAFLLELDTDVLEPLSHWVAVVLDMSHAMGIVGGYVMFAAPVFNLTREAYGVY